MKAYRLVTKFFPDHESIYLAENAAKAKYYQFLNIQDANYGYKFGEYLKGVSVNRAAKFDDCQPMNKRTHCLGWRQYSRAGLSGKIVCEEGCLKQ